MRTAAALETHGHLVALVPPERGDPLRRRVHTVRAALEADRVAIVPVDLPPLAVLLLGRATAPARRHRPRPGRARRCRPAAVALPPLRRPARLGRQARPGAVRRRRPSVKSLVPGRHFAVLAHPEPHLCEARPDAVPAGPGLRHPARRRARPRRGPRLGHRPARRRLAQPSTCGRCRCPPTPRAGGAPAGWSSSPPTSPTSACSTNWSPRSGGTPAPGAGSKSSATAACSARPRLDERAAPAEPPRAAAAGAAPPRVAAPRAAQARRPPRRIPPTSTRNHER